MHAPENCRIVVTGMGLWTPFGRERESSWRGIVEGRSAVRWLGAPHWTGDWPMPGAPLFWSDQARFQRRDPLIELGISTAIEAIADAHLADQSLKESSVGVVFGTSKGGLHTFAKMFAENRTGLKQTSGLGDDMDDSHEWQDVFPNQAALEIGRIVGSNGPVLCPIAACATGLAACLRGAELIQSGDCDVVLAGSADVSLQPALLSSFRRLGVISRELLDPAAACRPFDRNRSGFAVGEGAACLVLEGLNHARARRANIYAEWIGGRMLSDPFGLTQLDPQGATLKRLLRDLTTIAGSEPDYVNLHGTGTVSNDRVECQAIREVFGNRADNFQCSSLKGGLGHLLGAAGSVELAATVLSIRDQIVPPTVNLLELDPECSLKLTPRIAMKKRIDRAWKISLGFGGHIAGACLARSDDI